jgi:hypothetical protein
VAVEQQQEARVDDRLALRRLRRDLLAVQEDPDRPRVAATPVALRHAPPVRTHPPHVGEVGARRASPFEKRRRPEDRMRAPELDQPPRELDERALVVVPVPVNHESSLSWHHALLLPCCVRPNSSPPRSIGTPCERKSVVRKFRCCR